MTNASGKTKEMGKGKKGLSVLQGSPTTSTFVSNRKAWAERSKTLRKLVGQSEPRF